MSQHAIKHDYQVGNLIITWIFRIIKYQWFENSNNNYGLKNPVETAIKKYEQHLSINLHAYGFSTELRGHKFC